jgi:hypothetical protein
MSSTCTYQDTRLATLREDAGILNFLGRSRIWKPFNAAKEIAEVEKQNSRENAAVSETVPTGKFANKNSGH